jgi:ubiquinone/menaquinone biosynthesis C-methylase UbiE
LAVPHVPTVEEFKERVKQDWANDTIAAAWRKWHPQFSEQTRSLTEAILEIAAVQPGIRILDLASGTGEPALALAQAVEPDGHVTATDLSPGMLAAAEENALSAGLSNLSFQVADAHDLPFPNETFDVVTSRLGVMFFVDLRQALGEIRRVIKPGGRAAFVAWGPIDDNPFFAGTLKPLSQRVGAPTPPPDAPTPFRFAEGGTLTTALQHAGFKDVREESRLVAYRWPGTAEELWAMVQEIGPQFQTMFTELSADEQGQIGKEVIANLHVYSSQDGLDLPARIVLVSAVR